MSKPKHQMRSSTREKYTNVIYDFSMYEGTMFEWTLQTHCGKSLLYAMLDAGLYRYVKGGQFVPNYTRVGEVSDEDVHAILQDTAVRMAKINAKNMQRRKGKGAKPTNGISPKATDRRPALDTKPTIIENITEQQAIALLKRKGYEVYKIERVLI